MKVFTQIDDALIAVKQGKIIAYPTEAVFGLGCDPFNQQAVEALLALKKRDITKGMILIINNWHQLDNLSQPLSQQQHTQLTQHWPGPVTFLLPKSQHIPYWISGQHSKVAVRMTNHPIAKQLCQSTPLVSTSANISTLQPALTHQQLREQFSDGIAGIVEGKLGSQQQPSQIIDITTQQRLR